MPKNLPPYSPLYIARFQAEEERQEKIDIGSFVAHFLVKGNQRIFISGGTTAAIAGIEILCKYPRMHVVTHSIPLAWHLMEFKSRNLLVDSATVDVVAGHVDCESGVISHDRLGKLRSEIFVYAPRSLDERGVNFNNDEKAIEAAWKCHNGVIMLATYSRLLDEGGEMFKHIGMIRKGAGRRACELVMPETLPKDFSGEEKKRVAAIIEEFKKNNVKIHKAPHCKKSKWYDYFAPSRKK